VNLAYTLSGAKVPATMLRCVPQTEKNDLNIIEGRTQPSAETTLLGTHGM